MEDQLDVDGYDETPGGGLDLKILLLYGLGRSRFLVAFFVFVGTAIGLVVAAAQPNLYTSSARLHFLAGKREGLTPEAVAGLDTSWQPSIGMADEMYLLDNREIFKKVAVQLGLRRVLERPDPRAYDRRDTPPHVRLLHWVQWQLNARQSKGACYDENNEDCVRQAGLALKQRTHIEALPYSNVIAVRHESTSPLRAQEFAQALVEAFVARHQEAYSVQPHAQDTREDMLGAYDELQMAVEHYREHRKLCGFQSLGDETTDLRQQIMDLKKELRENRARRTQVSGELEEYEKYLKSIPEFKDSVTEPIYGPNPEYEYVQRERLDRRLELAMVEGEAVFGDRERKRELIGRQIEALTAQLQGMNPLLELKPMVIEEVPNPEYFEYKRKLDALVAEDHGLGLTIDEKEKNLRQLLEQLDLAGECEKTHDHWERKIKDADQDHTQLKETYYQLRSLSNLDEEGESNLRIYQAAILPLNKSGPKRAKTVLMGLFGGLAIGAVIAALRQLVEARVRYPRTLERQLGLSVLAVVPEAAGLRKLARRRAADSA